MATHSSTKSHTSTTSANTAVERILARMAYTQAMPMNAALSAQEARGLLMQAESIEADARGPVLAEIQAFMAARGVTDSFALRTLAELKNSADAEIPADRHGSSKRPDAQPTPAAVAVASMQAVTLAISHDFDEKTARARRSYGYGWKNATLSPAALAEHILSGRAICVSALHGTHRDRTAFQAAQIVGVDIDAAATPQAVLDAVPLAADAFLIYPTASSTPDNPRCRVLFALDEPITSAADYVGLAKRVIAAFAAHFAGVDTACHDAVRIFYGSHQPGAITAPARRLNPASVPALPEPIAAPDVAIAPIASAPATTRPAAVKARRPAPPMPADTLRVDGELARLAYGLGYDAAALLYFMARHIDTQGAGWAELHALHGAISGLGGVSWRTLRYRWIPQGIAAGFFTLGTDGRLYLASYERVSVKLAEAAIAQGKTGLLIAGAESLLNAPGGWIAVPLAMLRTTGRLKLSAWHAAGYLAWHAGRRAGRQISRHILCTLWGLSTANNAGVPVLLRWEAEAGIESQPHYGVYAEAAAAPAHAIRQEGAPIRGRLSNSYTVGEKIRRRRTQTTKRARQAVQHIAQSWQIGAGESRDMQVVPKIYFTDAKDMPADTAIHAHLHKHQDMNRPHFAYVGTSKRGIAWHAHTTLVLSARPLLYVKGA